MSSRSCPSARDPWLAADGLPGIAAQARGAAGDVGGGLEIANLVGSAVRGPARGETWRLWSTMAVVASEDLTVARVAEPHLDALAILEQAEMRSDLAVIGVGESSTWGVFAAEGPAQRLGAEIGGPTGWRLHGVKPWCSIAGQLSHALVTAWVSEHQRCLFAVRLQGPGVTTHDASWVGRGLAGVTTGPVAFDSVDAVAVGSPGWYLTRPGFAWGGIGVAACWYGGAVGVGRQLLPVPNPRRAPDQIALMHLGAVDAALYTAGCVLRDAATLVDSGRARGADGHLVALRTRQVVADTADLVIRHVDHALGPAVLAFDEEHARRVDDLRLYVRQHHAERDTAALGAHLSDPLHGWTDTP